jgi:hypothetical protein
LASTCSVTHAAPADQPQSVQQITERLFPAYTVEGGRICLGGCSLEDRLILRLNFRHAQKTLEIYLNAEGKEIAGEPVAGSPRVELAALVSPPAPFGPEVERLLAAGARLAQERLPAGAEAELVAATAIWCKHVDGKLRFTIGSASLDLPFSGWTRTLTPPRLVCPYTGMATYHLAATDDGRIAAAEQIQPCAETGRRMLSIELVSCAVTGRRVAPDLVEACPVSGRRALKTHLVRCGMCRQRVSPAVLERGVCMACRSLKRVNKADPRMARVLHEHPTLDRWRRWRLAETAKVYVLVARGWFKRLLVVVDKESLDLKLVATGGCLAARWDPADAAQYPYILRE